MVDEQWLTMALMDGFFMVGNNQVIVLVNEVAYATKIDLH